MRKGVGKIIAGVILILAMFVIPFLGMAPLFMEAFRLVRQDPPELVSPPGRVELQIEEPGDYVVWNHVKGIENGETYSFPEALPDGLRFVLRNEQTQTTLPLTGTLTAETSSPEHRKVSVGKFEVSEPGEYTFIVHGDETRRYFSLEKSIFAGGDFLVFMVGGLLGGCLSPVLGLLLIIWGIINLANADKQPA